MFNINEQALYLLTSLSVLYIALPDVKLTCNSFVCVNNNLYW